MRANICVSLFFLITKARKGKKAHKDEPALYFLCPLKKGPLLMRVPSWWSVGCGRCDSYTCWKGVHILLCGHPLTTLGSFRLSICRGSGGCGGRRNDDRKDSGNYWEEQWVAMKNGTEGGIYFISRSGITYCRENGCGWYRGGREGLHAVCLDLMLLAQLVL
jgi:hypothetical protein